MQDARDFDALFMFAEDDQISAVNSGVHRHGPVGSDRVGLRMLGDSRDASEQFVEKCSGPLRIVARNIVDDLAEVCASRLGYDEVGHSSLPE